jgi:hypothetical protein
VNLGREQVKLLDQLLDRAARMLSRMPALFDATPWRGNRAGAAVKLLMRLGVSAAVVVGCGGQEAGSTGITRCSR